MSFNQETYINKYNKENYKMYQFRVKKSDRETIRFLNSITNKNKYFNSLINNKIYTLKFIKQTIKPILNKYNIFDIYLFGSYARGEATNESDIDIYCERGNIKGLFDLSKLKEELELKLNKKTDIIFIGAKLDDYFKNQIEEDLIKLC